MLSLDEIRAENRILEQVIFDLERLLALHRRHVEQNKVDEGRILEDMARLNAERLARGLPF